MTSFTSLDLCFMTLFVLLNKIGEDAMMASFDICII